MADFTVHIPRLSVAISEATLIDVLVGDGGHVDEGDPLFLVETEKVETEVPAGASGTVHWTGRHRHDVSHRYGDRRHPPIVRSDVERERGPIVHVEPIGVDLELAPGETIIEAAWRYGYHWPTVCYGQAECTVCHVEVQSGAEHLTPVDDEERDALEHRLPGGRPTRSHADPARVPRTGNRRRHRAQERGSAAARSAMII